MIHVAHLFDETFGWEQRVGATQLLDRLSGDRFRQTAAAVHPDAWKSARGALYRSLILCNGTPLSSPLIKGGKRGVARYTKTESTSAGLGPLPDVERHSCVPWTGALRAPAIARFIHRRRIDLVQAWGVPAALAARFSEDTPLVVQLFDPVVAVQSARRLRAIAREKHFAVACSTQIVRRRLIERGVPADVCVVIRPGVDFGLINRVRRADLRASLGIGDRECAVIVPEPASRHAGQFDAVYGALLYNHLGDRTVRIVLPGVSRERRRILRFASNLPLQTPIIVPPCGTPFEQLVAMSDVLLTTPRGDASTTAIAWAMASQSLVIGSATYAVSELIASRVNGLLFKQTPGRSMLPAIFAKLSDRDDLERIREVARGQAYQVFGLRRCVEQYEKLYDNVLSGRPPGEDITDSAMDV